MVSFFTLKFLTMQDLKSFRKIPHNVRSIHLKSYIVRNFYQAWTWSSLPSMSKISIMSSLASKNFKNPTLWGIFANGLTFHFKIPHNAGFKKFLKDSSQCWIYPGKNPTLWGIFVKLELNHHWHQCQRSQWCHQRLNKIIIGIFFISKFLTMQDSKCFSKNSSQCWI